MGRDDGSTDAFEIAAASFEEASDQIYDLRTAAFAIRQRLESSENWVRERERDVAASPAVQMPPEDGAHNTETRMARTVTILSRDETYRTHLATVEQAREDAAHTDAELERWRDRRSVARRRMDLHVALARPDDLIEVASGDSHA